MNKQRLRDVLRNPPTPLLILLYTLTAFAIAGSIAALTVPQFPTYLGYIAYCLAALFLAYSVYTVVHLVPRMKQKALAWIEQHRFTRDLKKDFGFRTLVFSIFSFVISIAHGILNATLGVLSLSVWYGALAAYYILLSLLRGSILLHHARSIDDVSATEPFTIALRRTRAYRDCGILLLLLQIALSVAIAQMIFDDRSFHYDMEWMVFAVAAYTFYKIIAAIINFFKAHKQSDPAVEAIRNINLADATVSILALQTTLLSAYGTEASSVAAFHTVTGTAVSLFTLGLGIFMITRGCKQIKRLKTEQAHGK